MPGIYVVGMPRSGTTLVQSLIATSQEVISFKETHFFNKTRRLFKENPNILDIMLANAKANNALLRIGVRKTFWATDASSCVTKLHQIMNGYAAQRGYRYYLEKTPSHLYVSRSLFGLGDACKLVFVVRGLFRNVESYLKVANAWSKSYDESDLSAAVARWYQDTCLAVLRAREYNGLLISYDKLVDDNSREKEISRLSNFLDLSLKQDQQSISTAAVAIVEGNEYWKHNNKRYGIEKLARPPVSIVLTERVTELQNKLDELMLQNDSAK